VLIVNRCTPLGVIIDKRILKVILFWQFFGDFFLFDFTRNLVRNNWIFRFECG
jgi:hypothetical protein